MQTIDIQVNNAKIMNYLVDLTGELPEISATIGLFCGETKVSEFGLRTQTYYSNGISFKLPPDMIIPITEIAKQLEVILVRECNKQFKQLPAAKIIKERKKNEN